MDKLVAITQTVPAATIAYGLWTASSLTDENQPDLGFRDLTLSWLRFGYQGPVIESASLESILTQAISANCQACFIQTPGNIISEDWLLPHWRQPDFHQCLQAQLQRQEFLICAEVIETHQYFGLDSSCMLINLKHYQRLNRPKFGAATNRIHSLIKPRVHRSQTDDSSSSIEQLQPSLEQQQLAPSTPGWQFIDASLRGGVAICSLPTTLASKRLSLSSHPTNPNHNSAGLRENTHQQVLREKFLAGVETQICRGRSGVFLWNIESYDDIPEDNCQVPGNGREISHLYCVAAGFKPNMLLHRHGFTGDTEVTFFDYSQMALNIRKTLLAQWDGTDYPTFCRQLMQRYPVTETFYQLWNGLQPKDIDWNDVDQLWQDELTHWGGAERFRKSWQAQRRLNFRFIHCDIIDDPSRLLANIANKPGATVWWSNAFFTISSNWLLSIEQRRQRFYQWIEELVKCSPNAQLYGADHNNTPVNNICATHYFAQLTERFVNADDDELAPRLAAARPLRF